MAQQALGFKGIEDIEIKDFKILTPKVKIGNFLGFQFNIKNTASDVKKLRVEYGIYYQKSNGSLSKKVFKISEKNYAEDSSTLIIRKHPFKKITTRVFHTGKHQVSIIMNGKEIAKKEFELI